MQIMNHGRMPLMKHAVHGLRRLMRLLMRISIDVYKRVLRPIGRRLAGQLVDSGTSIGANLEEADGAQSRADFISKCTISLKEARESHYWLRIMRATKKLEDERLLTECNEIVAILTTIVRKTRHE